jgi:hypothetical protein
MVMLVKACRHLSQGKLREIMDNWRELARLVCGDRVAAIVEDGN